MRARPARATSRSSSVALGCLDVVVVDDEDDLSDVDVGVDAWCFALPLQAATTSRPMTNTDRLLMIESFPRL